jgi:hypothetical protein
MSNKANFYALEKKTFITVHQDLLINIIGVASGILFGQILFFVLTVLESLNVLWLGLYGLGAMFLKRFILKYPKAETSESEWSSGG